MDDSAPGIMSQGVEQQGGGQLAALGDSVARPDPDSGPVEFGFKSSVGMRLVMEDVRAFMAAAGQSTPAVLVPPSEQVRQLRIALIDEEVNRELLPALWQGDLEDIADACADAIVVIVGTALAYGIPLHRVWHEVDRANRDKIGADGKVTVRDDGKILKPAGWRPPDVSGALGL